MFRILTSQGPHAPGGAKNYMVDGKMTAGFAFVAYPVDYRSSGVMTFIVDASGTIYEKDLRPNTTKLAQAMTAYDRIPPGTMSIERDVWSCLCHALRPLYASPFSSLLHTLLDRQG
jgi:hypothetical protein